MPPISHIGAGAALPELNLTAIPGGPAAILNQALETRPADVEQVLGGVAEAERGVSISGALMAPIY